MPTRVFLSYARGDDEPFVHRLCADLTAAGFTVWLDRESLMSRGLTFHQEIKDAIRTEVDRIVYVGGPKAALSAYCREEWQLGLEFDHVVVTPILRKGDLGTSLPGELSLLNCDDFSDDAKYDSALAKFIANLSQPNPKLGALLGVPSLPPHFLARPELMRRVRDALLVDLQTAQVITSADARVGVQGMGGIGKSVLAAALARNRKVRESYPDGIVWVSFGQNLTRDDLLSRLRELVARLGSDAAFTSLPQGQGVLRALLQAKSVLLVLDDVWRASDAKEFDHLGPRCRMLVTTRDAGILHTLHGELVPVSLFTSTEALQLLADAVGLEPSALPAEARAVADECGLLPLALALSGGMAKKHGGDFHSVLERLRCADLGKIADSESINDVYRSIWRAMQASVQMLREEEQHLFAELSVFSESEPVPEAAVATLWTHTGSLDGLDTGELLIDLAERSLIQLDQKVDADGRIQRRVTLHDLLRDYTTRIAGDTKALHQALRAAGTLGGTCDRELTSKNRRLPQWFTTAEWCTPAELIQLILAGWVAMTGIGWLRGSRTDGHVENAFFRLADWAYARFQKDKVFLSYLDAHPMLDWILASILSVVILAITGLLLVTLTDRRRVFRLFGSPSLKSSLLLLRFDSWRLRPFNEGSLNALLGIIDGISIIIISLICWNETSSKFYHLFLLFGLVFLLWRPLHAVYPPGVLILANSNFRANQLQSAIRGVSRPLRVDRFMHMVPVIILDLRRPTLELEYELDSLLADGLLGKTLVLKGDYSSHLDLTHAQRAMLERLEVLVDKPRMFTESELVAYFHGCMQGSNKFPQLCRFG